MTPVSKGGIKPYRQVLASYNYVARLSRSDKTVVGSLGVLKSPPYLSTAKSNSIGTQHVLNVSGNTGHERHRAFEERDIKID
jgi:hypothetical protein